MPACNSPWGIYISIKKPWNSLESETCLQGPKGSDTEPASKINRNCCILRESLAVWLKVPFILAGDANWSPRIRTFIFKALCKHQPLHLHTIASREVNMCSSSILCFLEVQRSTRCFFTGTVCVHTQKGAFDNLFLCGQMSFPRPPGELVAEKGLAERSCYPARCSVRPASPGRHQGISLHPSHTLRCCTGQIIACHPL